MPEEPVVKSKPAKPGSFDTVVELIAKYRQGQVASANYFKNGSEYCASVGGAVIAKSPIITLAGKAADERAKSDCAALIQEYGKFGTSDVFAHSEKDGVYTVTSKDGRKYVVNPASGTVA